MKKEDAVQAPAQHKKNKHLLLLQAHERLVSWITPLVLQLLLSWSVSGGEPQKGKTVENKKADLRWIATLVVVVQAFNMQVLMYVMGRGRVVSRGRGEGGPEIYVLMVPTVIMTRKLASGKKLA